MYGIVLKPIGIVRTDASDDEIRNSLFGVEGVIEVFEDYVDGLDGIEGFSHIILIAYLHKVSEEQRKVLKVRFRRFLRFGLKPEELPEVGVFASDSPHRPNPIAISIVELVERKHRFLYVKNLDLFDGTPILDIKPYTRSRVIEDVRYPEWYIRLSRIVKERFGISI